MQSRIIYIERKAGRLIGKARIGRVTLSETGRTLYYQGQSFQSLKGAGFKSNFYELESGEDYWISGPRRDRADPYCRRVCAFPTYAPEPTNSDHPGLGTLTFRLRPLEAATTK